MLVIILAPLPLGSNREWSWTLLAVLISGLSLIWLLLSASKPKSISTQLNPGIYLLFLLTCAWVLIQASGWLPVSWHHPLWSMTSEALGTKPGGSISVSSEDSQTALMRLLSYALVFFLSFQFGKSRKNALQAIRLLAFAGLAYAIFGLIKYWSGDAGLFWLQETSISSVHSTFINRNSYATYAGLTLLCAIAWFYQSVSVHRSNRVYEMPQGREIRIEQFILKTWKPLTAILLLSTALILTNSRGGFISSFLGCIVLLIALNARQKIKTQRSKAIIVTVITVAALAFFMSSEVLLERMDKIDVEGNQRLAVYELIAEPLKQGHFKGLGYGTFSDSFRMYRSDEISGHYDKAHNTYLENIFELGWPAALLLFTSIGWLAIICLKGIKQRGRDWVYPATGLAATVLVGVHSAFDFSLQIPAVAVTYTCIIGIACAQSYSSRL